MQCCEELAIQATTVETKSGLEGKPFFVNQRALDGVLYAIGLNSSTDLRAFCKRNKIFPCPGKDQFKAGQAISGKTFAKLVGAVVKARAVQMRIKPEALSDRMKTMTDDELQAELEASLLLLSNASPKDDPDPVDECEEQAGAEAQIATSLTGSGLRWNRTAAVLCTCSAVIIAASLALFFAFSFRSSLELEGFVGKTFAFSGSGVHAHRSSVAQPENVTGEFEVLSIEPKADGIAIKTRYFASYRRQLQDPIVPISEWKSPQGNADFTVDARTREVVLSRAKAREIPKISSGDLNHSSHALALSAMESKLEELIK